MTGIYSHQRDTRVPCPPQPCQYLMSFVFSNRYKAVFHCVFHLRFPGISDADTFCVYFLDICMSSSEKKCLFKYFTHVFHLCAILLLNYMSFLYVVGIGSLSAITWGCLCYEIISDIICKYYSHGIGCLILVIIYFALLISWMQSHLF